MGQESRTVIRDELYELVWQTPITKLAADWGVLPVRIVEACESMNVPRPPSGHWSLVRQGWEVPRVPLPAAETGKPTSVVISPPHRKPRNERNPDARALENAPACVVKVPNDLRSAHTEVRKMKQHLVGGYTDATGLINSLRNHKVLRVKVSKPHIDRALRIIDGLVKALEERGAKFVRVENSELKEIRVDGERIECFVMEETVREKRSDEELDKSPFRSQWVFRATGRLRFEIDQYTPVGGQKKWTDGESSKIEDQLGEIVQRMFEVAGDLKKWQTERELQDRQWREAQQLRQEEERRRQVEVGHLKNLEEQARNWATAKDVQAFVEACEASMKSGGELAPDGWERRWLAWAREHVARLDPLGSGFLEGESRRFGADTR